MDWVLAFEALWCCAKVAGVAFPLAIMVSDPIPAACHAKTIYFGALA